MVRMADVAPRATRAVAVTTPTAKRFAWRGASSLSSSSIELYSMVRTAERRPRLSEEVVEALRPGGSLCGEKARRRSPSAGLRPGTKVNLGLRGSRRYGLGRAAAREGPASSGRMRAAPSTSHRRARGGALAEDNGRARRREFQNKAAHKPLPPPAPVPALLAHELEIEEGARRREEAALRARARGPRRRPDPAYLQIRRHAQKLTRPSPEPRSCCRLLTRSTAAPK